MKKLGKHIKMLRTSKKWTQETLAKKIKVERTHLVNMEGGHRLPSLNVFCRLVKVLHVDPNTLLDIKWKLVKKKNLKPSVSRSKKSVL